MRQQRHRGLRRGAFKAGTAHVTGRQSSQARAKGLDLANHKEPQVPFAQDISEK